jgi:prophage antirepressor-like protein
MGLDKTFFLDIFNQIFKVNDDEIIIIFDTDGEVWFSLRNIFELLKYQNIDKVITNMQIKNKKEYDDIRVTPGGVDLYNMQPRQLFINESGLYEVLSKSNKPIAEVFKNKYFEEIMPEIRKKGKYIIKKSEKKKLDKLNNKINNYEQELTYYYDKYNFEPSKNGYFYINQDIVIKKGKQIICYKIGYCKDMEKRMLSYKVGNFNYKPLAYITLNFTNGKEIEDCVKDKYKPHIIKLKSDTLCHLSLTKLKEEILICIETLNNHICNCMICKKSYKFKDLDSHKCYNKSGFIDINNITKKSSKKTTKKTTKRLSKKLTKKSSKNKKLI